MSSTSIPEVILVTPRMFTYKHIVWAILRQANRISEEGREPELVNIGVRMPWRLCESLAGQVEDLLKTAVGLPTARDLGVQEVTAMPRGFGGWVLVARIWT